MAVTSLGTYITVKGLAYTGLILICLVLPLGLLTDFPLVPFALILAVFWIVLNVRYPYVGLLCYAVFILVRPNEFITALSIPMIEKAIVAPVFLGLIIKVIFSRKREFLRTSLERVIVGFVGVAFLSILTSVWVSGAWKSWFDVFRLLIIFVFVIQLIDTEKQFRLFVFIFLLTGGFHAVSSIVQYYMGIRGFAMGIDRAIGMDLSYGAPNSLAATVIYTLPFIYCYYLSTRSRLMRLFLISVTLASTWCIILTGSRTGMLGVVFFVILVAMQHENKLRNFLIGFVLLVVAFVAMPDQYRARLESSTDLSGQSGAAMSAHGRIDGLVNGVRMMIDRPLLGVGIGQYRVALGSIYGKGWWEAHSLPGQLFGDLGLLGTIAFVAWVWTLFGNLRRLDRHPRDSHRGAVFLNAIVLAVKMEILCLLFMGLGGHNLYRYNWFFASAMVVVMLKLTRDRLAPSVDAATEASEESNRSAQNG